MARLSHNSEETLLKCHNCDIIFRHEESERVNPKQWTVREDMWESPCCRRRYSLMESDNDNEICAVATHGYGRRKDRDKHGRSLPDGIDWAWVDG